MTQAYEFTVGSHNEQAHDYTSALIDEAYKRKANGSPMTSDERVSKANALCEAYYAQMDDKPAEAVLSRLAWYIVFDEMTDAHPDKMTREEYPILSRGQQQRRRKEVPSKNVYFDGNNSTGFRTVFEKNSGNDVGYVKKYPIYNAISDESLLKQDAMIDVIPLLHNANLSDRQREAIELVYFEDMTQEQAGEVMGVNKSNVNEYLKHGIAKIRRNLRRMS